MQCCPVANDPQAAPVQQVELFARQGVRVTNGRSWIRQLKTWQAPAHATHMAKEDKQTLLSTFAAFDIATSSHVGSTQQSSRRETAPQNG